MKAKIYNFRCWVTETNSERLKAVISSLLVASGFNVCGALDYYFTPQGYTALWLLSESHCAVHTFPERGKTYIELSSCIREQYVAFVEMIPFSFTKTEPDR